jgi:hypothetical protein
LPVPAPARISVPLRLRRCGEVGRLAARSLVAAPVLAASVVGATSRAALTGAAVAARLLWPRILEGGPGPPTPAAQPAVRITYARVEVHWSGQS